MKKVAQVTLGILLAVAPVAAAPAQSSRLIARGPSVVWLADRGNARAQTRLGTMLATGRGAPQNIIEAAHWFRRAAEQGNPDAQYLLGNCYDLGKGVPRDFVLAHKWFNLSAAITGGGEEREHRAKMRDAVASKMSREDLAKAQELAIVWRPKPERHQGR
jgi:TPR repeat protein